MNRGETTAIDDGVNHAMHPVMTVLASGVPLTLLLDLLRPGGPDSQLIYQTESAPDPAGGHHARSGE